jgi:hypothetical protein
MWLVSKASLLTRGWQMLQQIWKHAQSSAHTTTAISIYLWVTRQSGTNHRAPKVLHRITFVWTNHRAPMKPNFIYRWWRRWMTCAYIPVVRVVCFPVNWQVWILIWCHCETGVDVYALSHIPMLFLYIHGMLTTPNEISNIYEVYRKVPGLLLL